MLFQTKCLEKLSKHPTVSLQGIPHKEVKVLTPLNKKKNHSRQKTFVGAVCASKYGRRYTMMNFDIHPCAVRFQSEHLPSIDKAYFEIVTKKDPTSTTRYVVVVVVVRLYLDTGKNHQLYLSAKVYF